MEKQVEALLHIVSYYQAAHQQDFPVDKQFGGLSHLQIHQLAPEVSSLLKDIYHHMRCDRINAASMIDIIRFAEDNEDRYGNISGILRTCLSLSRGSIFKNSNLPSLETPENFPISLHREVEESYSLAKSGQWRRVLGLWIDAPVLANRCSRYCKPGSSWTFLHQAAYFNHQEACRLLILRGAMVDALNRDERTPADIASEKGHHETERFLRRASLGPNSPWAPSPDPEFLPASDLWLEALEAEAQSDLFTAHNGNTTRIAKGEPIM